MNAAEQRRIGVTVKTKWTGTNNMKDPNFLIKAQDTAWNDPALKARDGKTFCNMSWLKVCQAVGCHDFDPAPGKEPYVADELWWFFQRKENAGKFLEKDLNDVQDLANRGALIAAVLPSWILKEVHGHIVSITPGEHVWSEGLQKFVPVCMNIATVALSSRKVGLNWAFPMKRVMPKFYAWKESL